MQEFFQPRLLQFRLTTLLIGMAGIAACCAWYGTRFRAMERQEEAFRQLASKGGFVHVRVDGTSVYFARPRGVCGTGLKRVIEPGDRPLAFTDADIDLLEHVLRLRYVEFGGANVTPQAVGEFRRKRKD